MSDKIKHFDFLFIGTSPISALFASKLAENGAKVLVVDKNLEIGGAWQTLNIFDTSEVENAVHYFTPNQRAYKFMETHLDWQLFNPKRYICFNILGKPRLLFKNENRFAYVLCRFMQDFNRSRRTLTSTVRKIPSYLRAAVNDEPKYVVGGAGTIINTTKRLLASKGIETKLGCNISSLNLDLSSKRVSFRLGESEAEANAVFIPQGTLLPSLNGLPDLVSITRKSDRRPAFHLFVKDQSVNEFKELIFANDPVVKYVHDITGYTTACEHYRRNFKIFTFALTHEQDYQETLKFKLIKKLQAAKLLSKHCKFVDEKWSEIYLPELEASDLRTLEVSSKGLIRALSTDNLTSAIEDFATKYPTRHC